MDLFFDYSVHWEEPSDYYYGEYSMDLDGGSLKIRKPPNYETQYFLPYKLTWHAPSEHTLGGLDNSNTAYAYDIEM